MVGGNLLSEFFYKIGYFKQFLLNHHGEGDPQLARSDSDIYLTYCAEDWGTDALALEFILRPGIFTLAMAFATMRHSVQVITWKN